MMPLEVPSGLTQGEAKVLLAQIAGVDPERIRGWTLIFQDPDGAVGVVSSAISAESGYQRAQVLFMLLDAATTISDDMRHQL